MLQRLQQTFGIVFHRLNAQAAEDLWEGPLHHLAVLNDIGDARRTAQIVFEHIKLSVAIADQIGSDHMAPHTAGWFQSAALFEIARSREQQLRRHDTVFDDPLIVVDVINEKVQRGDALLQPAFDHRELGPIDDARHDIERPNFFGPRRVAIDGERDAHVQQSQVRRLLPPDQLAV